MRDTTNTLTVDEGGSVAIYPVMFVGGLWPLYWVMGGHEKTRCFLGKTRLIAHLAKLQLLHSNTKIVDTQGILK